MMSAVSTPQCGQRMMDSVAGSAISRSYSCLWVSAPQGALFTSGKLDSVPRMKAVFAALLLLFQLQPVLGTVACLDLSDRPAQQECQMPEHGRMQTTSISVSGAAAQSCQLATICTPAPLAIPGLFTSLETRVPVHEGARMLAATLPRGISPAPSFHPPRA